jgi:hypothetical protein
VEGGNGFNPTWGLVKIIAYAIPTPASNSSVTPVSTFHNLPIIPQARKIHLQQYNLKQLALELLLAEVKRNFP